MSRKLDLTGQKFGRLTVISDAGRNSKNQNMWLCLCECSGQKIVLTGCLRSGNVKSCGCLNKEAQNLALRTHGLTYKHRNEYVVWSSMRQRCSNKNNPRFKNYGGRGIKVCERWNDFENFITDMGSRPNASYSIDRINNDGDYEPSNCRWTTCSIQNFNKRTKYTSQLSKMSLRQECKARGLKYHSVHSRLVRGWAIDDALSTPIRNIKITRRVS